MNITSVLDGLVKIVSGVWERIEKIISDLIGHGNKMIKSENAVAEIPKANSVLSVDERLKNVLIYWFNFDKEEIKPETKIIEYPDPDPDFDLDTSPDSTRRLLVQLRIEKEFGISINREEMARIQTFQDAVHCVIDVKLRLHIGE